MLHPQVQSIQSTIQKYSKFVFHILHTELLCYAILHNLILVIQQQP
ncbi:hypothetical protein X975_04942, partial [Stegodyphus mimosarum]